MMNGVTDIQQVPNGNGTITITQTIDEDSAENTTHDSEHGHGETSETTTEKQTHDSDDEVLATVASEHHVAVRESEENVSFKQHVSDMANVFKAFIGSNYLNIAFAFKMSGLVLGLAGLALIAGLTDLCCHIIVKCKYAAMRKMISQAEIRARLDGMEFDEDESKIVFQRMVKSMQYGDIGMVAIGPVGRILVNIFIMLTQFGFCVSYFIFIGNTIGTIFSCEKYTAFPIANGSYPINSTISPISTHHIDVRSLPILNDGVESIVNTKYSHDNVHNLNLDAVTFDSYNGSDSNTTTTTSTTDNPKPKADPWADIHKAASTCLPPLAVLVLTPLPLFIAFSLIRHVRQMGLISILADISIFGGIICMLAYLSSTFLVTTFKLVNWSSFPIFVGAVTGAYEGIGTIIPIESSMEGNRKNFPFFLHCAVLGLSGLLAVLGILGYLQFGEHVEQMINLNISMDTYMMMVISKFVDATLCIGILLTFPLQIFPVIELLETYIFAEGRILGPKKRTDSDSMSSESTSLDDSEEGANLINTTSRFQNMGFTVAVEIPSSVQTWKRNTLRVFVVLVCCGVGVLCRNIYAYVGAFIGAVGSTMLAFVLPCVFQIALCGQDMHRIYTIRNIGIIFIGLLAGVVSVYSIVNDLIHPPV